MSSPNFRLALVPPRGPHSSAHLGDPCIHCGIRFDEVPIGPCVKATGLAARMRELMFFEAELHRRAHAWKLEEARLSKEIASRRSTLNQAEVGLDPEKIALAETVLFVSDYSKGGSERNSARLDAIKWFATGKPINGYYGDLRREFFGTKNYDRWSGQRSDCEYGCGPSHGSICFRIELRPPMRSGEILEEERDAAIYYLVNLERIQASRAPAKAQGR